MIGRPQPSISLQELRAVVAHVRALQPESRRPSRARIWAYAAFLVILLGSVRAETPRAYLPSSLNPIEESRMRTLQSLGVVSSFAIASVATAQSAVQWRVEDGGNGHWYQWKPQGTFSSWIAARDAASAAGGYLASVRSESEEQFARSVIGVWTCGLAAESSTAIGGFQPNPNDVSCCWEWVSGEPWGTWQPWSGGAPNNGPSEPESIALMRREAGWNDGNIQYGAYWSCRIAAMFEWSADCNNDGIVDYGQIRAGELVDTNANNIPDCCEQGFDCRFTATQWTAAVGGNGHWYEHRVKSGYISWFGARDEAVTLGGHLATLKSPAENAFVFALIPQSMHQPGAWLGGFQMPGSVEPGGGWVWVDGEPFAWTNWSGLAPNNSFCGLPTEDYLHFFDPSGVWNDLAGDYTTCVAPINHYVAEWSADCNNDDVVDYGQIRAGQLADTNANNIPDCCESGHSCDPCPADVDNSGAVNGVDLAAILNVWGTQGGKYPRADINRDGIVNGPDLAEVLSAWGACQ